MRRTIDSARPIATCVAAMLLAATGVVFAGASQAAPPAAPTRLFAAQRANQVRVMTWNIGANSIFPADGAKVDPSSDSRTGQFARVLRAIHPDVLCLQEVTREPAVIEAFIAEALGPGNTDRWHAQTTFDTVIVSRYPLSLPSGQVFTDGPLRRGHVAALVDLPDNLYARDLYVLCAHFQSKAGQAEVALRQRQADAIAAWLRDARTPGGEITLPSGTPFAIMGDLNVIDSPSPSLRTLVTGDIADEKTFGVDAKPDWDDSDLRDLVPRQNLAESEVYTWRDDLQQFPPGTLDRIICSDSVLVVGSAFVLNTTRMTGDQLRQAGLRANDIMYAPAGGVHDHLPVVADFGVAPSVTTSGRRTP